MSTEDKKEQAINPQPEYDEPSEPAARPEQDESRIGGQALGDSSPSGASPGRAGRDVESTGSQGERG